MYLEVVADTAWTASRANENMRRRQQDPSQNFTPVMSAKLDSNQLRRHAGDKDWDDQCCRPLVFSYSIPGRTDGHVAGASAAYENQAYRALKLETVYKPIGSRSQPSDDPRVLTLLMVPTTLKPFGSVEVKK